MSVLSPNGIGQLLEQAAGTVRPREADPVAAVRRRVRRQRRVRGGFAAGLAAALAVVVGVGAVAVRPEPAAPSFGTVVSGPAEVTVTDGVLRAGGLRLPLPGWTVAPADQPICDTAEHTVFLAGAPIPGGPCTTGPAYITARGADPRRQREPNRSTGFRQVVLAGGQPAWLGAASVEALTTAAAPDRRFVQLYVPWSGVELSFSMPAGEIRDLVAAIRTEPVAPGPLVLPEGPASVAVVTETGSSRSGMATVAVTDPVRVRDLRALLAGLRQPAGAACPPDTRMRRLTFLDGAGAALGTVQVSTTAGCSEATSSLGGRVRIPDGLWGPLAAAEAAR